MPGIFNAGIFNNAIFNTAAEETTRPEIGAKVRRAAERQQYIYYRRARIAEKAPPAVAAAIERVVERYEDDSAPALAAAVGLLRKELRSDRAAEEYVELLRHEIALIDVRRAQDDEDAEQAAIVMLLH